VVPKFSPNRLIIAENLGCPLNDFFCYLAIVIRGAVDVKVFLKVYRVKILIQ
jgi:hypothetical protein